MKYKRKVPWLKVIPIEREITRMCAKVHRQHLENQEKSAHYKCQLMIDTNKIDASTWNQSHNDLDFGMKWI